MTTETDIPSLASLEYIPYIDASGQLSEQFQSKVGVYAIFDQEKVLQFVGYSAMLISASSSTSCANLKVLLDQSANIDRPSRTILESIRDAWTAENGDTSWQWIRGSEMDSAHRCKSSHDR